MMNRPLKRAGVQEQDMLKVFRSSVRPILEYAVRGGKTSLTMHLSGRIESVLKRAFEIIYPKSSYSQALSLANETTLSNRRELLCNKFMAEMTDTHYHPLLCLMSTAVHRTNPYNLRPSSSRPLNLFTTTKRLENIFTFKYSSFEYPS